MSDESPTTGWTYRPWSNRWANDATGALITDEEMALLRVARAAMRAMQAMAGYEPPEEEA